MLALALAPALAPALTPFLTSVSRHAHAWDHHASKWQWQGSGSEAATQRGQIGRQEQRANAGAAREEREEREHKEGELRGEGAISS